MKEYIVNPFLPEFEYIPDGEPHVFDGRVYLYGSHDIANGETFCLRNYVCYSADCSDLKSWRYEGIIFDRMEDKRFHEKKSELWAPDVVNGKDGRYYLYYVPSTIPGIGVAVCDEPAGTYKYHGIVHWPDGTQPGGFDPAGFVDDDGTCYLYSGGGPRILEHAGNGGGSDVYVLEDDMCTIRSYHKSNIGILGNSEGTGFEGHELFEASSIRKFNGKYYFIYSSCHLHELCYAISDRPDDGYEFGGVLVSNVDIMEHEGNKTAKNSIGNNHGSVECINGEYYIFYHRQTNGTMFSRQACAEKLVMTEDGKFLQAKNTSCGLNGGPLPGEGIYPAACCCLLFGKNPHEIAFSKEGRIRQAYLTQDGEDFDMEDYVDADKSQLPRQYIKNAQDGTHAVFRYFDLQCLKKVSVTTRGNASGMLKIKAGEDGEVIAAISIEPSTEWKVFGAEAKVADGIYELDLNYEGEGAVEILEFMLEK